MLMATTEEADFGDTWVYLDSCGIANVLSLNHPGKKFWVTYDSSDCGSVLEVHTKKGVMEFKPTPKGLHALDLNANPETTFLLVNNANLHISKPKHQLHVATVWENYDGFTRKQIEGANEACCLMGMIATSSMHNFQALVHLNLLKDCPVTNEDIKNAHTLYGPYLATIRGETVWCKPTRVITDYDDIPRALVDMNQRVTLAVNVMFVNLFPFLVSVLHNINLITIEHAPHRMATKLGSLIHHILCV
jgi:hypothetical protein